MEAITNREGLRLSQQEEAALTAEDAKALLLALTITCSKHGRAMLLCYQDWPSHTRMRTVPWRAFEVPGTEPLTPLAREFHTCSECADEAATQVPRYASFQGVADRVPIDESLLEPLTDVHSAYRRHEQRLEQVMTHALVEALKRA